MSAGIVFEVLGVPRAQPRGRHVSGRVVSTTGPAKRWRSRVQEAATIAGLAAMPDGKGGIRVLGGAVEFCLVVRFPTKRPERWGGWRTATKDRDFDNLLKLAADACVDARLLEDDGQVARSVYEAVWCAPGQEGVTVAIQALQARRREAGEVLGGRAGAGQAVSGAGGIPAWLSGA